MKLSATKDEVDQFRKSKLVFLCFYAFEIMFTEGDLEIRSHCMLHSCRAIVCSQCQYCFLVIRGMYHNLFLLCYCLQYYLCYSEQ